MDDGSLASRSSSYHSCQHSGYVPVHFSNDEERDYPGLLKKSYTEVLKVGFSLNWSAQNCSNCETIGGRCGFERNQFVCFCAHGPHLETCEDGSVWWWNHSLLSSKT
ncbi:hypothetical protein Csa_014289 [Cucumis sativus]|nr:hypothetical protein Csa_014289 [Cucumis sativus]